MAQDKNQVTVTINPPPEPVKAEVAVKVEDPSDLNRMVRVRPRQSIPRTRIGGTYYSLQAGKEILLPKHVANLLEEKGVL